MMLNVVKPQLVIRGTQVRAFLSHKKNGPRRLSTAAAEPAKPAAPGGASEEPGWPMKYKVAGGVVLGTIIPWMVSYAVSNDPGSRRLVGNVSPGLVRYLRKRAGGHFWDEDPQRLAYLDSLPEWINQPVSMEVRTNRGETRRLLDVDARQPFSSVGRMVQGSEAGDGSAAGWVTDFSVLDEGDRGDGEQGDGGASRSEAARNSASTWDSASSHSSFDSDNTSLPSSNIAHGVRRDVAGCNINSWWDIAAMEVAQSRAPAPETSESYRASSSSNGAASSVGLGNRAAHGQKMSNADQAKAMVEHIDTMIEALEQDKLTGARSVDDVQDEVRDLRKQQKELRRKHGVRRKFLGLF